MTERTRNATQWIRAMRERFPELCEGSPKRETQ
jgi:hypothetical protein